MVLPFIWQDDEYVVYNTNQQRLRFLIEFSLPDDKPTTLPVCDNEGAKDVKEDVDVDNITEELSTPIGIFDCTIFLLHLFDFSENF